MNPVLLLAIYGLACSLCLTLYLSGTLHRIGLINTLERLVLQRFPSLQNCSGFPRWLRYLLVLTYHAVVLCCHLVAIYDVLPTLSLLKSTALVNMPALMYHLWTIHTLAYLMCVLSNPGIIHRRNYRSALDVYAYDGLVYKPGTNCNTCLWNKPARSKHCSICNRCVHRFDHHCVWINCCIGAYNYRYFLAVLITGIVMCCNGCAMCGQFFIFVYHSRGLSVYKYIDSYGRRQSVNGLVLAQYMFYEYPRVVILCCSLLLLAVLLLLFTLHHTILVVHNHTTNEAYKLDALDEASKSQHDKTYNRGMIRNILEVVLPARLTSENLDKSD